jgi:hypothetical protein
MTWRASPRCVQIITTSRTVEMTCGDEAGLAIVAPVIHDRRRAAGKHFLRPREIEATMVASQITLRRVEGYLYGKNCTPNKCQAFSLGLLRRCADLYTVAGVRTRAPEASVGGALLRVSMAKPAAAL